jgi:hypothetical protein
MVADRSSESSMGVDITYIRIGKGFMYLFKIIYWYSLKVFELRAFQHAGEGICVALF